MELIFTILTMVLAFTNAYQAGRLMTTMDIDRIEGKVFDKTRAVLILFNILCSFYFIISLYGTGINRGLQ